MRVHVCEGYVLSLADHERRASVLGMIKPLQDVHRNRLLNVYNSRYTRSLAEVSL